MVVTTENKKKSKGFLSGLNQLRVGDYKIAVTEIKAALGINNRNSFYAYRKFTLAILDNMLAGKEVGQDTRLVAYPKAEVYEVVEI